MNAAMRELEREVVMAEGDQANLAIQVAELRSDVRHVQSDVTDIKADLRISNQRIESLRKETGERFDRQDARFDALKQQMDARCDALKHEMDASFEKQQRDTNARFDKQDARFDKQDARFDKIDQKFEAVYREMGEIKESLSSAKIWALGLYIALAGSLFYALARGFKWV